MLSQKEGDVAKTTVTASFYRERVDSGYQAMISAKAEAGIFDWSILRRMDEVFRSGKYEPVTMYKSHTYCIFWVGYQNMSCTVGVQTDLNNPLPIELDVEEEDEELLGTPKKIRLTSFPTGHFLDLYF